jgi:hypothetical protein
VCLMGVRKGKLHALVRYPQLRHEPAAALCNMQVEEQKQLQKMQWRVWCWKCEGGAWLAVGGCYARP